MYKYVYFVFLSDSVLVYHGYTKVNIGSWKVETQLKYLPHY